MNKKNYIRCSILILLVSFVFSVIGVAKYSVHKIQSVYQPDYRQGYLYGIDMDKNQYYIFRVDPETGEQKCIAYPIAKEDSTVTLSHLSMGKDEKLYVYHKEYDRDTNTTTETIDYCDFSADKLTPRLELDKEKFIDKAEEFSYFLPREDQELFLVTTTENNTRMYHLQENGEVTFYRTLDFPNLPVWLLTIDNKLDLWLTTYNGDVYHTNENDLFELVFENDGSQVSVHNVDYTFENQGLHFMNIDDGNFYQVSEESSEHKVELCEEHKKLDTEAFDMTQISSAHATDVEGIKVGILQQEDGTQVPVLYGETEYLLSELQWSVPKMILMTLLCFVCFSALGVAYIWAFYFIKRKKGGAPIWGITTLLLLPLICIVFIGSTYMMNQQQTNEKMEEQFRLLEEIGTLAKAKIPLDELGLFRQKEILTDADIEEMQWIPSGAMNYYDNNSYTEETILMDLFLFKEDEVYSANYDYRWNVPAYDFLNQNIYQTLLTVAREKKTESISYNDFTGRYMSVFLPITNYYGETLGVMEVKTEILNKVLEQSAQGNNRIRTMASISLALFAGVQLILLFSTRSIKTLKNAMVTLEEGDWSARARLKGKNEVAIIGKSFDDMAEQIQSQIYDLEQLQKHYEAFIPAGLFSILKKRGITEIALGDYVFFRAIHMKIVYTIGSHREKSYDALLSEQIVTIQSYGGMIHRILENGMDCIFYDIAPHRVLDCAVALQKHQTEGEITFHGGIAIEETKMGIIGSEKRMLLAVVEEKGGKSAFLKKLAQQYHISALVCGECMQEAANYHSRLLGYLYSEEKKCTEQIYELLDGIPQEMLRIKLETKQDFEEGIQLFMTGAWVQARKAFISILEKNPADQVAKQYILLCELGMRTEEAEKPKGFAIY